jgi:hypothetical protein
MLVTEQDEAASVANSSPEPVEEPTPAPIAVEERPESSPRQKGPRFFSSASKTEERTESASKADPIAARLTRGLWGKSAESGAEKERVQEKKGATASAGSRPAASSSARPKSNFKMKYIWGMMFYLLVADFLGVWIQSFMQSHGLDAVVFTVSAFQARRSTLVFLALLIVILVVMARLDLIPRSLGAAMAGSSTTSRSTSGSKAASFERKEPAPAIKQGVQGEHDDLYREYRQNQRYYQKRDRKR